MGENLDVEGRNSVRTPMQWSTGRNGGFSAAAPSRLPAAVTGGGFGPEHVNVADQRRDPDSLLAFVTLLIRRYRECPELGWGSFEVLDQPQPAVLAHRCTWDDGSILLLHNLGPEPASVPVQLAGCDDTHLLVDLIAADAPIRLDGHGAATLQLEGYGHRWLRVDAESSRRLP
jgi:glycosidase